MPMDNLIEQKDNYSNKAGSLWQYCTDEPFLDANGNIADFPTDNNSALFQLKIKTVGRIGNDDKKDAKIMVPLKYSSNFWRTLRMLLLINCEISLMLTWSANYFIINGPVDNQVPKFTKTNTILIFQL